jgi:hypothetical protein
MIADAPRSTACSIPDIPVTCSDISQRTKTNCVIGMCVPPTNSHFIKMKASINTLYIELTNGTATLCKQTEYRVVYSEIKIDSQLTTQLVYPRR